MTVNNLGEKAVIILGLGDYIRLSNPEGPVCEVWRQSRGKPKHLAFLHRSFASTILAMSLNLFSTCYAADITCKASKTQIDWDLCSLQHYQAADREMNHAYLRLLRKADKEDAYIEKNGVLKEQGIVYESGAKSIRAAQDLWVKFRDAECHYNGIQFQGGSIRPAVENECMFKLTVGRTKRLNAYTLCHSEHDILCNGGGSLTDLAGLHSLNTGMLEGRSFNAN